MELKEAYRLVLEDLKKCKMFRGIYDAENGSLDYMTGIGTVMEVIAMQLEEKDYNEFCEMFTENLQDSIDKARHL